MVKPVCFNLSRVGPRLGPGPDATDRSSEGLRDTDFAVRLKLKMTKRLQGSFTAGVFLDS